MMNALHYTQKMVEFPSVSNVSNVAVSNYLEDVLKALGFATERIEYTDPAGVDKANIIGKKGSGQGGMAYFAHTDVVPADPWFSTEHGPFEPTVKDDKLYGRGSCDMKGSIGSMLAATEEVGGTDLKEPLYIVLTAAEEDGYGGAQQVAKRSKYFREMVEGESNGIVGEPTMLDVVHAHKGSYGFKAISYGRAAHSSTNKGLNANLAMIPFLSEMKKLHDETLDDPAWQHAEFDPPGISWNIGINDHTPALNMTAAESVCTVYFRPAPGHDAEALIERARKAAEQSGIEFVRLWTGQPLYTDPASDFVGEVLSLSGNEKAQTVPYGTDGAALTEMKNMVVIGPGDIAQAHTYDEWVLLDQLDKGTQFFAKLIRQWCT
jgi:acetylornithine deacetylase